MCLSDSDVVGVCVCVRAVVSVEIMASGILEMVPVAILCFSML